MNKMVMKARLMAQRTMKHFRSFFFRIIHVHRYVGVYVYEAR